MQEIIIFAEQMLLDPHSRPTSGIDVLLALLACWPTKAYNQVVLHLIMLLCFVTSLL